MSMEKSMMMLSGHPLSMVQAFHVTDQGFYVAENLYLEQNVANLVFLIAGCSETEL
jgi:hypothetical protein